MSAEQTLFSGSGRSYLPGCGLGSALPVPGSHRLEVSGFIAAIKGPVQ